MIKLPFTITTTLSCTTILLLSLYTLLLLQIQPVNAGISSFHDLQKKLSPSPLDVLDNLEEYEKFWIEVHPKSCGEFLILLFVCLFVWCMYCNHVGQFIYHIGCSLTIGILLHVIYNMTRSGDDRRRWWSIAIYFFIHLMH